MHELLSRALEYLRDAWRFRWHGMLVAWVICVVGWLLVYSLPNVYNVEARIRIDTTSVIRPLIEDLTVSPGAAWKVDLLINTVLSKPNLKEIARRTGLAIQATTPAAEQQLLARLGHKINIRSQHSGINLYSISYTGSDAREARDIVQAVINVMTGMALGNGVQESQRAIAFLKSKVEEYHTRLRETEQKLTEFKKNHPALIKGRAGYLARLQTTRAVLAQMKVKLETLLNKQASLQEQLQSLASNSVVIPPSSSAEVQALDQRIDQHQAKLRQLLTRYTAQHPDVVRNKQIIDRLQQKRQALVAQLRANPQRIPGTSTGAYQAVKQRLNELQVEIDTLRAAIDRKALQTQILASNSGQATTAAAQLADLSRNYETTKEQYKALLSRLNKARLSRDVDTFGNPLDFQIIDPPVIPDAPSGPPRMLFMLVVLIMGLGGGGIFSFFLAQIKPVFMTRRKLAEVTDFPVLGAVSMAWNVRQRIQHRTSKAVFVLAIGVLVACFFAAVVLMPVGIRIVPSILGYQWI